MKKLIGILIVLFSFAANAKPLVYNSIDFAYTPFVYGVCEDLGIENQNIVIQFTNLEVKGFVRKLPNGYVIFIGRKTSDWAETIAHELVHVKQDIDGRWDVNNPTTIVRNYGNSYTGKGARKIEYEANKLGKKLAFKHNYGSFTRK